MKCGPAVTVFEAMVLKYSTPRTLPCIGSCVDNQNAPSVKHACTATF